MLKVDITPIFWNLISSINRTEYNKETCEFCFLQECMLNGRMMSLCVDMEKNITIESDDIKEIFMDLDLYYRTYDKYCDEHLSVIDALIKIYKRQELEHSVNHIDHMLDNFTFFEK